MNPPTHKENLDAHPRCATRPEANTPKLGRPFATIPITIEAQRDHYYAKLMQSDLATVFRKKVTKPSFITPDDITLEDVCHYRNTNTHRATKDYNTAKKTLLKTVETLSKIQGGGSYQKVLKTLHEHVNAFNVQQRYCDIRVLLNNSFSAKYYVVVDGEIYGSYTTAKVVGAIASGAKKPAQHKHVNNFLKD